MESKIAMLFYRILVWPKTTSLLFEEQKQKEVKNEFLEPSYKVFTELVNYLSEIIIYCILAI